MQLVKLLKSHVEKLREGIQERLVEGTMPRYVAMTLFEIWKKDLLANKVSQNEDGAYVSSKMLTLQQLEQEFKAAPNSVKPAVTHSREGLQSRDVEIPGYFVSLNITKQEYSFCVTVNPDPLATLRWIWGPYIGKQPIVVACEKRLFFKINKDVYVRNVTIDRDGSWNDCEVLKKLIQSVPVNTVRLYAPAGEISAAFAILDFFNNRLRVPAVGKLVYPHYEDAGQNLVVLGSGIEEHHYQAPADLGFCLKNFANGVEETNGKKHNDTVSGTKMKVHVLLQRWQTDDGSVVTVIYGSHAAAIEQVVKKLVSERLAASLIKSIPRIHWLRRRAHFECLIAVELDTTGKDFVLRSFTVVKPQQRRSHSVTKMRHPQRDLEKGA
jgi:hypothetical protein